MLATQHFEDVAAGNLYLRLFDDDGLVLDFADSTFKALSAATRPYLENNTYPVAAVTTGAAGAGAIAVATDITSLLVVGARIKISGSTGNDGIYTVRSGSSYSAPNTTVNVTEAVSDATVDGNLDIGVLEHGDLSGTGRSGYAADLDLSLLNSSGAAKHYLLRWYDNATPAAADLPVSEAADVWVQFSQTVQPGGEPVYGFAHVSVTSTAGNTAHVTAWLVWRGALVALNSSTTTSITITEVGNLGKTFTLLETNKLGATAAISDQLQLTKPSPNFTTDRQLMISGTITPGGTAVGVAFPLQSTQIVLG